jgi:hypothetical protein
VESSCECGNEHSGSIKCWEVLEWLHNWRTLSSVSSIELVTYFVRLFNLLVHKRFDLEIREYSRGDLSR